MALKKPANNDTVTKSAQFEEEPGMGQQDDAPWGDGAKTGDTATESTATATKTETRTVSQEPAEEVPSASAKVEATTAIAKASATSLSVNEGKNAAKAFQKEVEEMRGSSDFSFGNYRVFKGNNGDIVEMNGDKEKLGRWAKVRLIAWDEHFELSPGEDGASTKDFVAYSKDGKTIDSVIGEELKSWVGRNCNEYIEYLRNTEDFDKAKMRRFIDTGCALLATDSGDGPIGSVIQITLSESSIPAFKKYQQELTDKARCAAMGLAGFKIPEDPFTFFFIREHAEKGSNRWTKLKIAQDLPAKI